MYVLGIETSCDETAASIVKNGREILSNLVTSSLSFHKKYGGVVPEIASRMQLETIAQVVDCAVKEAKVKLKDIDLISVTSGPGLLGSLLVGISFAKSLSLSLGIPLLGIGHLYSHIFANFLQPRGDKKIRIVSFPFLALVVSGGHTSLFFIEDFDKAETLGATLDDACGEAFDKVAKILGLGYPGGPIIECLARKGNAKAIKFNCSGTDRPLDFSFSGIKTAVLYKVAKSPCLSGRQASHPACPAGRQVTSKSDIAASFQEAVINTLVQKALLACKLKKTNQLVIGGGVAMNNSLRERFCVGAKEAGVNIYFPSKALCMDNAAMVAGLGYYLFRKGYRSDLSLSADLN